MRFAIAYSKLDKAGINIVEQLKKIGFIPQIPIIELKKETIYSEFFDRSNQELKNIDFLIFTSRHASKEERKTFSLHAPGNWRGADFGGKEGKICRTSAFVLKFLFQQLNKNAQESKLDYEVTLECTHHGPLIELPCCFIEIGSTEKQWQDKEAAKVIAKTIASLQDYEKNPDWVPCLLIGGGHYNQAANKIMLKTNYAVGHIIPKYSLPLTASIVNEAEAKTQESIQTVLLDWKGLGEYKQETVDLLKKLGLKYERVQNILKVN